MEGSVVAHNDSAHFGLFKIQSQTDDAIAKVEHLVRHTGREAFDLADTVGNFADMPDVLLGHRCLCTGDLGLNFLEQGTHVFCVNWE